MSHYSFCNQDVPIHPSDSDYKNEQLLVTNTLLCCTNRVIIIKSYKYVHVDAQNIKVDILSGDHWPQIMLATNNFCYLACITSKTFTYANAAQCTTELLT